MSSQLITLLNAVSVAGAGSTQVLSSSAIYMGGNHTIEVSGTFVGTVVFEGRINTSWIPFSSLSAPGGDSVQGTFDAIRGNVTSFTSGAITMICRYPLLEDGLSTLLTRLSSTRAGYLDQLAAGNLPQDISTLLTRLSDARATLLDNLSRLDVSISTVSAVATLDNLIKQLRKEGRNVTK